MSLRGSEGQILQAIADIPKDLNGFVSDADIARFTGFRIEDVRDSLYSLSELVLISLVRVESGFKVMLTPDGALQLKAHLATHLQKEIRLSISSVKVFPKGLRSYDEHDADFFLELLPGPRHANGLPESIHFWKTRIEEMDPEKTFKVGTIFGPSGCGKSSLVKAGLLPRLSPIIFPIYVEATTTDTEASLQRKVKKFLPSLPDDTSLRNALLAAKESIRTEHRKLLLVIDQFEQWLHVNRAKNEMELASALRVCDGGRIQCILVIRDDFWMALTRFMEEVTIELHQGENFAAVDSFDLRHARRVLVAFGQAFGRLPADEEQLTRDHETFLTDAIEGIAQDARVIPIRLALFADMFGDRPWIPATLKKVGGLGGLSARNLDLTFSSAVLRSKQKAAQSVLNALVPKSGFDIRGHRKSHEELLLASGYSTRPREFEDLIRILDSELRLITPCEADGMYSEVGGLSLQRYYQLTHDYLVPSIREWLTRKQRETRRGRAELRLADRSAIWAARPENRHLPSALEWANIRLLTRKKDWTEPQRKMMNRAGRLHGLRTLGVVAGLVTLVLLGLDIRRRVVEANRETVATGLVDQVVRANIAQVPNIVRSMGGYRRWVDPALRQVVERSSERSSERLHAGLALLPVDDGQVEYLFQRLQEASADELPVLRDALEPHQTGLTPKLWSVLDSAKPGDPSLLPAASSLALYNPQNPRWNEVAAKVAQGLVTTNLVYLRTWLDALRPVRTSLTAPLAMIFQDRKRSESERTQVTNILADYASDDPDLLADLLLDSEEKPFAVLFDKLKARQERAVPVLEAELARKPAPDATADAQDQLAQRQARAAVALMRLEQGEKVWDLLRHSPDPSVRSYIVNWLKPLGAGPEALMTKLEGIAHDPVSIPKDGKFRMDSILFHPETSDRRALILALGRYNLDELSPDKRKPLVEHLLEMYRNDPDAGIHGAAEWTLRRWKQKEKLAAIDAELKKLKDRGNRRWYVNSEGQTFVVIEGPVEFSMGSPITDPDWKWSETLHRQGINRRFAVATKEVTVEQYQRFLKENPKIAPLEIDRYSAEPTGPMNGMTWYEATAYCNWLSQQEGLATCYQPNDEGEFAEGMKIVPDALKLPGYRLPTEAEWEYACRAGAVTSRYYGRSVELLGKYAWWSQNSQDRAWPCGQLLPNDLGLFDMLGNVYEWCQERAGLYTPDKDQGGNSEKNKANSTVDDTLRIVRGGAFPFPPSFVRSASRGRGLPSDRNTYNGFRIAITYP